MSWVTDYMKCPQCGGVMFSDFNCNTQEETRSCFNCGLCEEWRLEEDDEGLVKMEHHLNKGYGSMRLEYVDGGVYYPILSPIDENIRHDFLEAIEDPSCYKEKCYLTHYDFERNILICDYGKMPKTYEEEFDE